MIALRRANAASLLGDEHIFRASIGRARDELDRGFGADDPQWIRFVDHSEISTQEAIGHSNLGNYRAAIELYGMSLAAPDVAVRNRTCAHARLAAALAAEGDRSGALSEATAVLAVLGVGVKSTRVLNELRPVRDAAWQVNDAGCSSCCDWICASPRRRGGAGCPQSFKSFPVMPDPMLPCRSAGRNVGVIAYRHHCGRAAADGVMAVIMAADSAGLAAWETRLVQARLQRSSSSGVSR